MTTTPNWHAEALKDLETSNMSVAQIATKYGRSAVTIHKLLQRSKVVRQNPPARRGPRRRENTLPLSRQHHALGIRLSMLRGSEGAQAFADKLGVSPMALAQMEVGVYDFKLSQLMTISQLMKQPIDHLMKSFESNLYQGRPHGRS